MSATRLPSIDNRIERSVPKLAARCTIKRPLFDGIGVGVGRGRALEVAATAVFAMGAQLLMTFSLRWVDAMTVGVISQLAVLGRIIDEGPTTAGRHVTR